MSLSRWLKRLNNRQFSTYGEPVSPSIVPSSTFAFNKYQDCIDVAFGSKEGTIYTRWHNPTVSACEDKINELESGFGALLFPSGMSAITNSISSMLCPGDHIIVPKQLYSGTHEFFSRILPKLQNIEITWIEPSQCIESNDAINLYKSNIRTNTKILYNECPSNPSNSVIDLSSFAKLAQENGVISMIDSTFASPFNVAPIRDHSIDVCIHSCTKSLNGHSDVTAGTVICRNESHYNALLEHRRVTGNILSPFDSFLIHRGLKTLALRVHRINTNAMTVARWIETQNKEIVCDVNYCGLPSFAQNGTAEMNLRKSFDGDSMLFYDLPPGFGGTFSFDIGNDLDRNECFELLDGLEVIKRAVSLGGTESLIQHVASTTHNESLFDGPSGISQGLFRINIGLEPTQVIIKDLKSMFDHLKSKKKRKFI